LLIALLEQDDDATKAVLAGLDITPEAVTQRIEALLAERDLKSVTLCTGNRSPKESAASSRWLANCPPCRG
jgi:hypothetical protein